MQAKAKIVKSWEFPVIVFGVVLLCFAELLCFAPEKKHNLVTAGTCSSTERFLFVITDCISSITSAIHIYYVG